MKVIDLLNKIANGEEVPKKIKVRGEIFEFYERLENMFNYRQIVNGKYVDNYLCDEFIMDNKEFLNDTVEIIEEEKKIPEKLMPTSLKGIDNLDEKIEIAHIDTISVIETLNQLIDYLKSKGE